MVELFVFVHPLVKQVFNRRFNVERRRRKETRRELH